MGLVPCIQVVILLEYSVTVANKNFSQIDKQHMCILMIVVKLIIAAVDHCYSVLVPCEEPKLNGMSEFLQQQK